MKHKTELPINPKPWIYFHGIDHTLTTKRMKLAVVGSRDFKDVRFIRKEIDNLLQKLNIDTIVSGDGGSVDKEAINYAKEKKMKFEEYPADWSDMSEPCVVRINLRGQKYNALAGFKRNQKIVDACTIVLALWDHKSPGTKDTIAKATASGKKVFITKI